MAGSSGSGSVVRYSIQPVLSERDEFTREVQQLVNTVKSQFDLISSATWDGFKDYSRDTSKDVTKTWESTTKDMKNLTAKSLWGTVSAWFDDDMDQVENIWDNAWNSMIVSADKAWDGLPDIVARRLQRSRRKSQGPEVFPGALAFGEMLISASVP